MKAYSSSLPQRMSGLTLVELLVSMAIGLIILTAISLLFINNNRLQVEIDKRNRLIDNGRYALELLSGNLRLAGYFGEFDTNSIAAPGTLPDPCKTTSGIADLTELSNGIGFALQAYDAEDSTSTATSPTSCGLAGLLKPGSDVLVIRRALTTSVQHASIPMGNTAVYIQGSQCDADLPVFKVDVSAANLDRMTLQCASSPNKAPVSRMLQEIYFVAREHNVGDGIPTLKKIELKDDGTFSAPVPLVEGIEFLQISYGLDEDPIDGVPDNGDPTDGVLDDNNYVDCSGTSCDGKWDKVVAVKLFLIVRDNEATTGYTDALTYNLGPGGNFTPSGTEVTYRRQAYSQTVRLPNIGLRRE
jgi:type IV pilus assembly protein PilW